MKTIGTKLQSLRKNKNMTQAQLAEVLNVSPQSVSKWEHDLSAPDIAMLPVIARFFGITMDELFSYRLDALNYKERFIQFMINNGVLQFGEFRLKSGRISPYFIDTGNYRSASQIAKLGEFYAECMREHNVETNLLVGNTSREIPIMIAASLVLFNRYGMDIQYYIDHSVGKQPDIHDKVTLIKDTLTSGGTLKETLKVLRENSGQKVTNVIVSVDRMERGEGASLSARRELEEIYGVKVHSIVTLDDIIGAAEKGIIGGTEHLAALRKYREKYGEWK